MSTGLYISMAGLETSQSRLTQVAENLANVDTQGYAAAQTQAMGLPFVGADPMPGADVIPVQTTTDTRAGAIERTGDPFDVMVNKGWLVVNTAKGTQALTRNGVLSRNAAGLLVNQSGDPVLGVGGQPISLPVLQSMKIGSDGTISGIPAGAATQQPKVYGQLLLGATPQDHILKPIGNSLYELPGGANPTQATNATVEQGALEGSNVNSVSEMVGMIADTKSYQMQTVLVQQSAKLSGALDQVMTQ